MTGGFEVGFALVAEGADNKKWVFETHFTMKVMGSGKPSLFSSSVLPG
jgi:hypothetical protein